MEKKMENELVEMGLTGLVRNDGNEGMEQKMETAVGPGNLRMIQTTTLLGSLSGRIR